MRVCGLVAILHLIVTAVTDTAVAKNQEIGEVLNLMVRTVPHVVDGCFVKTPQNQVIELKPNDNSDGNKYQPLPDNAFSECQVDVTITDSSDNGRWSIYFTKNGTVVNTSKYDVTVKSAELEGETNTDTTTWLTPIEYIVTSGMIVEMSLIKVDDVSTCSVYTLNATYSPEDEENNGIKFIKTSSDLYASCRVQIGPIKDDGALLGDWNLCSQRVVDNDVVQECLKASISWNNNNPASNWDIEVQPKFNHPVNFGGNLTLTITNSGSVKSCHVITPSGNDLALSENTKYHHLTRIAPFTQCNVMIGPIDEHSLGDWTIYGIFTGFSGVKEVRLPTIFFLYNEQNPYDQAYNVTRPEPIVKISNTINTIDLEVKGKGKADSCDITPPENADIENDVVSIEDTDSCKYSIGPITDNMLGNWLVTGKFSNNDLYTEIQQVFTIKQEDPYNPEVEENRIVRYLESIRFETSIGATHEVVISGDQNYRIVESCHIRTPDGRQYSVIDGFHVPGVEAEKGNGCALKITVASKDMVGGWTLIARKSEFSVPVEERLNFTIYVEEQVEAVPSQVTIYESNALSVRLSNKIEAHESCKLYSPEGEYLAFEIDPEFHDYCGFIVRNIDATMNGTWQIVYEDGVVYRASIIVNIVRESEIELPDLTWVIDDKVDVSIGPDDVSYCQVFGPDGEVLFDGFGQCKIVVNRVRWLHEGTWTMKIGHQGKIIMNTYLFTVLVVEPSEHKTSLMTQVTTQTNPWSMLLRCYVTTPHEVQMCKFRDSRGTVLIASEGVAEDRYKTTSFSKLIDGGIYYYYECGLRIFDLTGDDNGIWRCAIDTANETYYGFLTVKDSDMTEEPVPKLIPNKDFVEAVTGDEVLMSCNIQTKISYCYFRKEDGTVYNLVPGISSDIEYVGVGFYAGECGIKYKIQSVRDAGQWSCNVGVNDTTFSQKKAVINVEVYDELTLKQYINGKALVINATAMRHHDSFLPSVDYCRYVRADGFSFTSQTLPFSYMSSKITGSTCLLLISKVSTVDYYPWTVTMKLKGRIRELTGVTSINITFYNYYWNSVALWLWLSITVLGLSLVVLGFSLGPKKNRERTLNRARIIRNSIRSSIRSNFRSSVRKDPLPLPNIEEDKPPAYTAA